MMSELWWLAIEVFLLFAVLGANEYFRIWRRTEAKARQLRSEKARVGLRTALYSAVVAIGMLIFGIEAIIQSSERCTSALVALAVILLGSFVAATLKTASETSPSEEVAPEGDVKSGS